MLEFSHKPVMLEECMEGLSLKAGGIWFDGTVAQWQAVTKWDGWDDGISRAVHCTDGDVL